MTRRVYSREYKREAALLVTMCGVSVAQAAKDLGERSIIPPNVLEREFEAESPNQKWVADFTYIWTAEGWLYVAAVVDLFSGRVVGWSVKDAMTA
jgi:putative transposase